MSAHTKKQEYQSDCICDTECRGFVNVKCKVAKQETLEEVAKNYAKESLDNDPIRILAFIKGAKWQSEQTQSELESLRAERDGLVEALRAVKERVQIIMSEPNGIVRETMINNLSIDLP